MNKSYEISVNGLFEELSSNDEIAKEKALRHLYHFDDQFKSDAVIKCLKSENSYIKEYSAKILGKLKEKKALKDLIKLLSDNDNIVREQVAIALGKIGDEKALKALIKASEDEDDFVREAVMWALGEIGSEKALECLFAGLNDKDGYVSNKAMESIIKIGQMNIEALVKKLYESHDMNKNDRNAILYDLIDDREEIDIIINQLENKQDYTPGTLEPRLKLKDILYSRRNVFEDLKRKELIRNCIENKEAVITAAGRLATWNHSESTGRSPKDTLCVKRKSNENEIDWKSPNNNPISEEHFDLLYKDALGFIKNKEKIYITNRTIGADSKFALSIKTVTSSALTALFTMNMFRPIPDDIIKSVFADKEFTLLVLPSDKLDENKYKNILRKLPCGETSRMVIVMDFERRLGIVIGSAYLGSVKKLMFTVQNYYLPSVGVLPLHCSANEGLDKDVALFLGLSGTGKTTLSADPYRKLIGDDEHGWSDKGIFNFENGCYAKLINLSQSKEPEIYNTAMTRSDYLENGAIVENAMVYPNGNLDLNDDRLTPNSRLSFPLSMLSNTKEGSKGDHPKVIIFLTADAYGVLPPIARLDKDQAMLWFLMGYTSKLAGTETGIIEPVATFSRFFGEPFMPRNPNVYARMLGEKLEKHGSSVYLINTGWTGGKYGEGNRIDINITRQMVYSTLSGELENVKYRKDELFHLDIPKSCPDIPDKILNPINTWKNKKEYQKTAKDLAKAFKEHFEKAYGDKDIDPAIIAQVPGK